MKYNRLGNTGLFVSEICLGTMTFSGENYFGGVIGTLGQKDATALIQRSLEARVNFIDTANVYSFGESEKMTGQALKDIGVARSDVVVATKADRLSGNERTRSAAALKRGLGVDDLLLCSAKTELGLKELWGMMRAIAADRSR